MVEDDIRRYLHAAGVRLLPKVKSEHINLTPRLRMRVNYAAQVSKLSTLLDIIALIVSTKLIILSLLYFKNHVINKTL